MAYRPPGPAQYGAGSVSYGGGANNAFPPQQQPSYAAGAPAYGRPQTAYGAPAYGYQQQQAQPLAPQPYYQQQPQVAPPPQQPQPTYSAGRPAYGSAAPPQQQQGPYGVAAAPAPYQQQPQRQQQQYQAQYQQPPQQQQWSQMRPAGAPAYRQQRQPAYGAPPPQQPAYQQQQQQQQQPAYQQQQQQAVYQQQPPPPQQQQRQQQPVYQQQMPPAGKPAYQATQPVPRPRTAPAPQQPQQLQQQPLAAPVPMAAPRHNVAPAAAPAATPVATPAAAPVPGAAAVAAAATEATLVAATQAVHIGRPAGATVCPVANFDAEADCKAIFGAMHGWGCDDKAIIAILTKRSAEQRLVISKTFITMYGKDIIRTIKGETSGDFKRLLVGLLMDRTQYDCMTLHTAMAKIGFSDKKALVETICTRTNQEIRDIVATYRQMYVGKELEKEIYDNTKGSLRRLLTSCIQGNRTEGQAVDYEKAKVEAEELYSSGEKRWGTDTSTFNRLLAMRSYEQLKATFKAYRAVSQYDIVRTIEHEFRGSAEDAFKAVAMTIQDTPGYFAERLYKSMKGLGTDGDTLVRLVVSRSEIDMVQIKDAFFDAYKKSLAKMIRDDCRGNFKNLLIGLVGEG